MIEYLDWQGFKAGGRRDFFIGYADLIAKFIEANRLKPVSANVNLSPDIKMKEMKAAGTAGSLYLIPWWYKGGKKFAHLHYAGEAYLLNEKQWQEFSTQVVADMSKKVAASRSVSFTGMLDLADAVSGMKSVI